MRYVLVGYGRMGRAIDAVATARGHRQVAQVDLRGAASMPEAEVAFEFTRGEHAERNVLELVRRGLSVVCGTTGWSPGEEFERAVTRSGRGVVLAPNFSIGVELFARLTREAGRLCAAVGGHDPWIFERHHRAKRDSPSGTARRLAGILLEQMPGLDRVVTGQPDGPPAPGSLPVASVRAGAESGTHVVGLDGEHETITLQHVARDRAGFALGAVQAAEWIGGRSGLHGFDAVVDDLLRHGPLASQQGDPR